MKPEDQKIITFDFEVNGFSVKAVFDVRTLYHVVDPLLDDFRETQEKLNHRMIVFLAAPPGAGKSTLAKLMEVRSEGLLQAVSIDGFHFRNEELEKMIIDRPEGPVRGTDVKGAPETFDVVKLKERLEMARKEDSCLFPVYDRRIHEPEDNRITITSPVLMIEGNWLLHPDNGWEKVKPLADLTIFLDAEEEDLKGGLVLRKMRGGLSREEAEAWFLTTDGPNIRKVKRLHTEEDLTLRRIREGYITLEQRQK